MSRYVLRPPEPRQRIMFEHALGEYATTIDGDLCELFEVLSSLSGEWVFQYEWKRCLTSD